MVMKSNVVMSSPDSGETNASSDIETGNQSNRCAESIEEKLSVISTTSLRQSSIYRVQQRIRQVKEDAYTPDMVSIGPYHRVNHNLFFWVKVNKDLKAMEIHKLEYVKAMLDRTKNTPTLEMYVNTLKKLEPEARGCYSEPLHDLSSEQFLEMMLIDGLFIIELFRKCSGIVPVDDNDPILKSYSRAASVVRDLVLLENQIPMSILQTLFDLSRNHDSSSLTLTEMALSFFRTLILESDAVDKSPGEKNTITHKHNHLVDLLRYRLCNTLPAASIVSTTEDSLPSVMELQRSGVKFKERLTYDSFIDIKFDNGVFEIPPVCINDHTDSFFRNLIAYEQCGFQGTPYMTSYAILMNYLINSVEDVAFLRRRRIIINQMSDDSMVSSLFNDLCSGISSNGFYYSELCDDVNEYYKDWYHNCKATFKRKYCSSPWSAVSVFAATLALFLTLWATVFTTLPVFNVHA